MRFLDTLDLYLTESKEPFDLYPIDFDSDDGASFGVDIDDADDTVAKIVIRTLDGTPVDALGGSYSYDEVYVDVELEGDSDDPKHLDTIDWIVNKFVKLGYDKNTIRVDGDVHFKGVDGGESETEVINIDDISDEEDYSKLWRVDDSDSETPTDDFATDTFDIDAKSNEDDEDSETQVKG